MLQRFANGPILTRSDIPTMIPEIVDPSSVFNPGAILVDGQTVLMLRVQTRGRRTFTVPAFSGDGRTFKVADQPVSFDWAGQEPAGPIFHIYDARISSVDDRLLVVTAVDMEEAGRGCCRLAIWEAVGDSAGPLRGLDQLRFLGWSAFADSRNGVLFPEQVNGRYLMLERPNREVAQGAPPSGNQIVLSESQDLQHWTEVGPVMSGNFHYWDELIGSGPPPIKTRHGWLHIYHGVATHFQASNIYQAGAVLLDLADPSQVLARTRDNILEPRETWELTGQVPNVVFPGGMTVSETDEQGFAHDDATLNIYYGAADTVVGLAQNTVADLVGACRG